MFNSPGEYLINYKFPKDFRLENCTDFRIIYDNYSTSVYLYLSAVTSYDTHQFVTTRFWKEAPDYNYRNQNIIVRVRNGYNRVSPNGEALDKLVFTIGTASNNLNFMPNIRFEYKYIPVEIVEFKLVEFLKDDINREYTYKFNKNIVVNKDDIEFKDQKGNLFDFDINVNGNYLIIIPSKELDEANYIITLKKVTSVENDVLTDFQPINFIIENNFYLTYKDFGNYIPSDLNKINFSFNKNFVVNSIKFDNNDIDFDIDNTNLIVNLSNLKDDENYSLVLNLRSVDGEKLELKYKLSTKSITGNNELDNFLYPVLNLFDNSKTFGITIIVLAIGVGVIFILSKFLFGKLKVWLKSV